MRYRILILCFAAMMLTGCHEEGTKTLEYRNSSYNFDEKNKMIPIEGYELNQLHPYDTEETEEGLEITFYFNKKIGDSLIAIPFSLCSFSMNVL